jgi:hypothetical protein
MMLKTRRRFVIVIVASVLGAAIWALSPWLTGYAEPWDANAAYYPFSLFGAGVLLGLTLPGDLPFHYLGAYLGQLAFMLAFLEVGPLIGLGLIFLGAYTLVVLLGVWPASTFRINYIDIRFRNHDHT